MMKKVGVLGAGQLGRMLALAGYPLELDFHFFDTSGSPSAGLACTTIDTSKEINSPKLQKFMSDVDVVTYEFEHLPLHLCQEIESKKGLYPGAHSLKVCQDRAQEKKLFVELGIPTPKFHIVESEKALKEAVAELGLPVVVKTTTEGYDGKGQYVIREESQCEDAWKSIGNRALIVEAFVNFSRELSIIAVRSKSDEIKVYPLAQNQHHEGILRYSIAPAPQVNEEARDQAERYAKDLIHELDHVGILTLELFETPDGLMANEMAPRVHNSGHWSIEGAYCSQFENHLRAICDLPLGSTDAKAPTCMINIIANKGDINGILSLPYTHLHLYGKEEREGRKLGHVTVQADSYEELTWRIRNVIEFLPGSPELSS